MSNELLSFGLLAFTSFFTLINPLGTMTIFMTMTSTLDDAERTRTAKKATIAAFITILAFAFSGQLLFKFFGISVNSFRVVGGVIFFIMGLDMLQARLVHIKVKKSEVKAYVNDISITPLAIPMICGPGAITNAIVLMEDATSIAHKLIELPPLGPLSSPNQHDRASSIVVNAQDDILPGLGDVPAFRHTVEEEEEP